MSSICSSQWIPEDRHQVPSPVPLPTHMACRFFLALSFILLLSSSGLLFFIFLWSALNQTGACWAAPQCYNDSIIHSTTGGSGGWSPMRSYTNVALVTVLQSGSRINIIGMPHCGGGYYKSRTLAYKSRTLACNFFLAGTGFQYLQRTFAPLWTHIWQQKRNLLHHVLTLAASMHVCGEDNISLFGISFQAARTPERVAFTRSSINYKWDVTRVISFPLYLYHGWWAYNGL
jgi:hypothetical protein